MCTVLVIHRSWVMRQVIKQELDACGHQVMCTSSSRLEALLTYRLHRPDVVLVDVGETNVARVIIRDVLGFDPKAALIGIVDGDGEIAALRAVVSGVQGLLVVPFHTDVLKLELERVLTSKDRFDSQDATSPHLSLYSALSYLRRTWSDWRFRTRTRERAEKLWQ